MKKIFKAVAFVMVIGTCIYTIGLVRDSATLKDQILRLHVVANSDSAEDQAVKLKVRDAVLAELEQITANAFDKDEAMGFVKENLNQLQIAADQVLEAHGFSEKTVVTLMEEAFPTRHYDCFSLPAGVYDSLRVTIGEGEGQNWWCVVFPQMCISAASVEDVAAGAGFSDSLSGAITGDEKYEIRFLLLDWLGGMKNFFRFR